jgi:hypothetical protein
VPGSFPFLDRRRRQSHDGGDRQRLEEAMMEAAQPVGTIAATLVFAALVLKLVDLLKYIKAGDGNGLLTLAIGFVAGIAAVAIVGETQWNDEIKIGDETLETMSRVSKVVLGLVATSVAAVVYDFKKAVDHTDSARTPRFTKEAENERDAAVAAAAPRVER